MSARTVVTRYARTPPPPHPRALHWIAGTRACGLHRPLISSRLFHAFLSPACLPPSRSFLIITLSLADRGRWPPCHHLLRPQLLRPNGQRGRHHQDRQGFRMQIQAVQGSCASSSLSPSSHHPCNGFCQRSSFAGSADGLCRWRWLHESVSIAAANSVAL
jgi:hypothetical protein